MLTTRLFIFVLIALSSFSAYAQQEFGIFMTVKGTVFVESGGSKTPAKVNAKVFPGSTIETGPGSRAKIQMSDRSLVHVSPDSKLKISTFTKEGATQKVELGLNQGKIRNEVKGSYGKENKFEVKTPTAVAGVRGTTFVVAHSLATNTTEVTTLQGVVEMTSLKNGAASGEPVLIKKDQKSSTSANTPVEAPKAITPEEKKTIETETVVADDSGSSKAPVSTGGNANKKNDKKDSDGTASGNNQDSSGTGTDSDKGKKDSGKIKIGNSKDTAPETFDPGTKAPVAGAPLPGTGPAPVIPTTAPNPRLNDAIRDKTDKTKVIIKPQ